MRGSGSSVPFFIDALPFAQAKKSGVGHISEGLTLGLAQLLQESGDSRIIYLVVPLRKAKYVRAYANKMIKIKTIPLPAKILHALNKFNLLPPMDIFLGKGNYIFPNYRNWRLLFSRSFTYIHDLSYRHFEEFTEPKNLAYLKKNIPVWIKRADTIITASKYTKQEIAMQLHVDQKKIYIVPHGVDTSVFFRYSRSRALSTTKSYGVMEGDYILHIGNIEPRKNILRLLEAYGQLPAATRKTHSLLLIGGDGWQNETEKQAIKDARTGGLRILRPNKYVEDSDLPAFYSAASVVAMPSFYEGFGMPPLQAMACETPTVVGGNSSLNEYFGKIAILVDPHNTESIKKGLEDAIAMRGKRYDQYREKARQIADSLSWKNTAQALLAVVDRTGL